jgi:hypothetical protein
MTARPAGGVIRARPPTFWEMECAAAAVRHLTVI